MLRPQKSYKNKYLDSKYLCEIPPVEPEWPEESFVPIFPRSRLPQSGMKNPQGNLPGLQDFTDLPSFIPDKVYVDDLDEDISRQNLIIVDGWRTHHFASPDITLMHHLTCRNHQIVTSIDAGVKSQR